MAFLIIELKECKQIISAHKRTSLMIVLYKLTQLDTILWRMLYLWVHHIGLLIIKE